MLTNLVEDSKIKCEQYWPMSLNEIKKFGPFDVILLNDQVMPDYVIRNMSVTVRKRCLYSLCFCYYR